MTGPIAIVGMSCVYPEARTPGELWENVLAQRRAFRRIPAERLRAEDYLDPDRNAPDRTYAAEAAVIEGYEFDRVAFRVVGSTYRSADLAHWLALDVASQALADAGFQNGDGLDRGTTGVILGNTLTGEFSRANILRLRWPYVRRIFDSALNEQGWSAEQRGEFLERVEQDYKEPFPPVGEESLAGGLSNTIAGRICNQFDFKGGGYTVDGACASSLLAVANACSSLAAGDLDVVLAGGVDLSLDPFEIVGFAKTGALAPELMRVYDARSAGFWPGEGCGFVVLMRHEDAIAQKARIYAVIRGWGISSDGTGGITRPEIDGQLQALRRAYRRAGYGIDTVEYFEGHGTGTSVGDTTELQALSRARHESKADAPPAAIGSVKANIGHTKAAAGAAGLLKAIMAVHTEVLPPTTGCERPHPEFSGASPALRVLREPEPWPAGRPLRAAVSAMGFGGMNAHLTLENTTTDRRRKLSTRERNLGDSAQDVELFLLAAPNETALREQINHLLTFSARLSRSELADLAAGLQRQLHPGTLRAAIVASSPLELTTRLEALRALLDQGSFPKPDVASSIFLGRATAAPRIGFLFPGQASPTNLSGGIYRRRFEIVRKLYDEAGLPAGSDGIATEVAQPAIVTASVAGLRVLALLGLDASVGVGHSLGEIVALHWAGVFDEAALLRIARARGRAMAELGSPTGAMAAIAAPSQEVESLLDGDPVSIVGFNSPRQTVIAGEAAAVRAVALRAQALGLRAVSLAVSHAFHTPLVAAAAPALARHLARETFFAPQRPIVSTVSGAPLSAEEDLRALLGRQVTSPVRFIEAIEQAEVDFWIEIGPGHVLSGLVAESMAKPAFAIDAGGASLEGLMQTVGAAFVLGALVNHAALFAGRFTRNFSLDWSPKFFVNPCELAPVTEESSKFKAQSSKLLSSNVSSPTERAIAGAPAAIGDPLAIGNRPSAITVVRQAVAERTELPVTAVKDDHRLLGDLHLNSITVGQLVAEAARRFGLAPPVGLNEFANATVDRVAQALEELVRTGAPAEAAAKNRFPPGIDSWIRTFTVELVEKALTSRPPPSGPGAWRIISSPDHPLASALSNTFAGAGGNGVVVCLPSTANEEHVSLMIEGARAALDSKPAARFVLVQNGQGAGGLARTLHLEAPEITVCIVNVPFDHARAAEWVRDEAMSAHDCIEAHYDTDGVRREPRLKLLSDPGEAEAIPLGPGDVLLVTGGGKGIAAECALAIARKTGVRLALIGRSQPRRDVELDANLRRISEAGVRCAYFAADVVDATAMRDAVATLERELGKVTAVLHGAGTNVPQLLSALDEAAFRRTLAPKVQGTRNALAAVDVDRLKVFVTFGSIIARAGLRGEADYALANEWLANLTEEFQAAHPQCRCLAIEWSVWSGVGMGQRLARIETLAQQGIAAISPDQGVEILCRLLGRGLPKASVVVTGRFGEAPTLEFDKPEMPFLRFLEKPRVFYPGVELVVDVPLATDSDPYLDEHVLHGERLFPAVMGLEAMAQMAMALTGNAAPPCFENVELNRPIVVPRAGKTVIRLAALARDTGLIEVVLRSEETGFAADHFKAVCRFGERGSSAEPARVAAAEVPGFASARLPMQIERDLYDDVLFHQGRFRRVKGYRHLRAKECLAEIEPDRDVNWFARFLPGDLVLGDAGARDAAIHCIQACIPHARLLPIGVERIELGSAPCMAKQRQTTSEGPSVLLLHARERCRKGDTFTYDLQLLSCDGCVLERWEGLRLRAVEELKHQTAWPVPMLAPWLERRVEELNGGAKVSVVLTEGREADRAGRSDVAIQQAAGSPWPVRRRTDGRPEVEGARNVSASHSGNLTLAVASEGSIGCDLERVTPRSDEVWHELLGASRHQLALLISIEVKEDFQIAATRVWTAGECLKKAGAMADAPLVLDAAKPDGWVLLSSGRLSIATCAPPVRQESGEIRIAMGVLVAKAS